MKEIKKSTKSLLGIYAVSLLLIAIVFAFVFLEMYFSSDIEHEAPTAKLKDAVNVVIDAGHGGRDGGASEGSVYEKDLNLAISLKLAEHLEKEGINVHLTRSYDTLLADDDAKNKKREDLFNRVQFTESIEEPIFISIHMNKFTDPQYGGLQVFYSPNNPYSEALALLLQDNNRKELQMSNTRAVKKATSSIYVLDRLTCPAVMIECGFLSNPNDLKNLTDSDYQDRLADMITKTVIEYLKL